MIQLKITSTGKSYGKDQKFSQFSDDLRNFKSMTEVKAFLKEQYPKAKRTKMYMETNAEPKHIGYVYKFRNADYSHVPIQKWIQEDWVEFREVTTITPKGV